MALARASSGSYLIRRARKRVSLRRMIVITSNRNVFILSNARGAFHYLPVPLGGAATRCGGSSKQGGGSRPLPSTGQIRLILAQERVWEGGRGEHQRKGRGVMREHMRMHPWQSSMPIMGTGHHGPHHALGGCGRVGSQLYALSKLLRVGWTLPPLAGPG